jgi:dsRNA-specific ribonuclease
MRFFASLKLNQYEVGKGYGSNKKNAKNIAAKLALNNLAPTLYAQW